MSQENEQSYRVNSELLPDLSELPRKHIEQVYLSPWPPDPAYPEVSNAEWRVRKTGEGSFSSTIKFGSKQDGSRGEIEVKVLPAGSFGTREQDIS